LIPRKRLHTPWRYLEDATFVSSSGRNMMKSRILVIDGHPDADRARFCHALANVYADAARAAGKQVRLITLAETKFSLLRTAAEFASIPEEPAILSARDDILWADNIVLIFPLWLGSAPALLRGFFEQIARAGFVAETTGRGIKQKLKGKSARLIVTMGMPAFVYRLIFRTHGLKSIMQGVLGFGGISPIRLTLMGAVEAANEQVQKRRLEKVAALARDGV
jgi:putative NADPH-quinone reductase